MRPGAGLAALPTRPGPLAYLSCIRYHDVLVRQGFPLLGVAFAPGYMTGATIVRGPVFEVESFLRAEPSGGFRVISR